MAKNQHIIISSKEHVKYIENLKNALKEKTRELQAVENDIKNKTAAYNAQLAKEEMVKKIWDQIETTDDLANKTSLAIGQSSVLSESAGTKAGFINHALKIVIVNIEDMADMIKGELEKNIDDINDAIKKLNTKPDPKSPIMESITKLDTAIEDALNAACDALDVAFPVYQKSTLLLYYLQNKEAKVNVQLNEKNSEGEFITEEVDVVGLPVLLNKFKEKINRNKFPFPYEDPPVVEEGGSFNLLVKGMKEVESNNLKHLEGELDALKKIKLLTLDKKDAIASSLAAADAARAC